MLHKQTLIMKKWLNSIHCFFLLRSKRWVINLRREDLMEYSTEQLYAQYTVCANHFEDSQFMNPAQKNRLIHNAVPTLIAQHNAPPKADTKKATT